MSTLPARTMRPEIETVLNTLRSRIQTYLLFHGTALVLAALCAGFLGTLAIDWIHFQIRKLELPAALRVVLMVGVLGGICWVLADRVLLRLLASKNSRGLALLLERRFPELNDRLITAVEFSDGRTRVLHTPLSDAMVDHTVSSIASRTEELELGDVFDWKPLIVAWAAAFVMLGGTAATIAASPRALERWTRAYVYFDEVYWLRETRLDVVVLADPGDRPREFVEGIYLHPRGADLKLLVTVPDGQRDWGGEWVVPDLVTIDYAFDQGRGGDKKVLARRGEREFQFKLPSVLEGLNFWISGHDYINRKPYRIVIVDPPQAESIALKCDYPDYTRLNVEELDVRTLKDEQFDIPLETWFELELRTNKPLRNATVQAGPYEFAIGRFSQRENETATLRTYDEGGASESSEPLPEGFVEAALSADRRTITLPFVLSSHEPATIAERRPSRLPGKWERPWILPPDAQIKIYLEDSDEIISPEPIRFVIRGQVDQPPVVESERYGIGTAITRRASIPIKGFITDDYGIEVAGFQFKVDDAEQFRTRGFKNRPEGAPLEFRLQGNEREVYERFEVLPTDLVEGQKLTLAVFARDGDNLNGPHETRGTLHTFLIVTSDELLGLLYEREINLRRQFEQIITEVERTRRDLLDHRELADERDRLRASSSRSPEDNRRLEEIDIALANSAERSLFQIGKNRAETAAIRDSFESILEELVNNGVHTRRMTTTLHNSILAPLTIIVEGKLPSDQAGSSDNLEGNFPAADSLVGLFREAMQEQLDPKPRIDESVKEISMMLARMRAVLSEMAELAELHEAITELREISEDFEDLRKRTIEERRNLLKDKLRDL
jgi:hypothetical protein